ncbi:MAG: glycoside hydrolase [Ruminococcaceae bacterium]|nr:glycoside hydrolase [Oscillospiraceae bacterium]
MKKSRIAAVLMAVITGVTMTNTAYAETQAVDITVSPSQEHKSISPYIYGVNTGVDLNKVSAESIRLGGNRLSAYNWENNVSNAGSDWHHNSDMYLVNDVDEDIKNLPGSPALQLSRDADDHDIPYTLLTLQMLGYTSSDKKGTVKEDKAAPSEFWDKVVNRKGSEFTLTPDTKDGYVYMDEYINYLINTLGDSSSETGIKAYALDNEPALWHHTHSRVQSQQLTCAELIEKSVDLAKTIKEMDSGAEVFGPSLFGYSAFDNFAGASDWMELRRQNLYRSFMDYYLDEMSKAEKECGTRLLDVFDIHFYTEQKGACGERSCNHYDNDECIQARLDSVRSLYEKGYRENSWIADMGARLFPLLPTIEKSINTYYPGTKLAFSEYNFGGGDHISGAVVQADMLGVFAEYGVYFASIWSFDKNEYQLSAINMFTNYDGAGNGFGDTLVKSEYESENISVYSSIDKDDENKVKVMVINRSIHDETPVNITLSSDKKYIGADVYSLYGDSPEIKQLQKVDAITDNAFAYTLPALSVTEFIINTAEATNVTVQESNTDLQSGNVNIPLIAGIGAGALALIGGAVALLCYLRKRKNTK